MVGEQGPEMLHMGPKGGHVNPLLSRSKRIPGMPVHHMSQLKPITQGDPAAPGGMDAAGLRAMILSKLSSGKTPEDF